MCASELEHSADDVRPLWETCSLCNYDRHRCPGCGIDVPHGTYACDECNRLTVRTDGDACSACDQPSAEEMLRIDGSVSDIPAHNNEST